MNPVFAANRYIKYRLKSFSLHGVHSPFIFDFNNTVLNDKTPFYSFRPIESLRSRMLLTNSTFNKKDWGTGNRNGLVKVSEIANRDLLPARYGQLLFKMVNYYRPEKILEMGTSLGITTLYLSTPNQNARLITLEGCPETMRLAQEHFDKLHARNITQLLVNSPLPFLMPCQNLGNWISYTSTETTAISLLWITLKNVFIIAMKIPSWCSTISTSAEGWKRHGMK